MNKIPTAIQRQRWRFERLVAVARSAYQDGQGELATRVLLVAWVAAEEQWQFGRVIAGAQFMLDNPIDGLDLMILQEVVNDTSRMEITLSA